MVSGISSNDQSVSASAVSSAVSNDQFVSQDTFLQLLITQLKNQDPMNPQDSSQFVAELAQFSSLEQMTALSTKMEAVLENSVVALIGQTVTVSDSSSSTGYVQGTVSGIVYYSDGPAVQVNGTAYPLSSIQNVGDISTDTSSTTSS
jgi:flagellar basal-body rod modification protein FlgD